MATQPPGPAEGLTRPQNPREVADLQQEEKKNRNLVMKHINFHLVYVAFLEKMSYKSLVIPLFDCEI